MKNTIFATVTALSIVLGWTSSELLAAPASVKVDVSAASYLGGTLGSDAVRGTVIQDDGTVVLSANISDASPGGIVPVLLNGATDATNGAIVRLSADGTTLLSVTRLADMVLDLDRDSAGNLYVALFTGGVAKLNPDATEVLWIKSGADLATTNVQRLDAGPNGTVVTLGGGQLDDGASLGDDVRVLDANGDVIGSFATSKWKNDVAIHEPSQTIIYLGYRGATDSASGFPVQVSYFRGVNYDGSIKYNGYDYSTKEDDPDYLNKIENNMADTRGYRAEIGEDGYLYLAFESAGGNNVFNHNPFDVTQKVGVVGDDFWQKPFNLTAAHITFVGRYNPADGTYITGTHLLTRTSSGAGNKMGISHGALAADAAGRVYVGGDSAWGLPIPGHPDYSFDSQNPAFTPGLVGDHLGGSHMVILNPDLTSRRYATRLTTSGTTRAIAVRTLQSGTQVAFGGNSDQDSYQLKAIQPERSGSADGWFGVIASTEGQAGNTAPDAAFSVNDVASGDGMVTLAFDASASTDPNGDSLEYTWMFGDGGHATGKTVEHTFDATGTYVLTLVVRDNRGGWSFVRRSIGAPIPSFKPSRYAVVAGQAVTFDASATRDPDNSVNDLTYEWDFGDGHTGTGRVTSYTYPEDGIRVVTLTVTDPLGGFSKYEQVIGVANPNRTSRRFDFDKETGRTTSPGFTSVALETYDVTRGFGWKKVYYAFQANTIKSPVGDALLDDSVWLAKWANTPDVGEFVVDLPNGTYQVIARFFNRENDEFAGVAVENRREIGEVDTSGGPQIHIFDVTVADGQFNLELIPYDWFIASLEILDIDNVEKSVANDSFEVGTREPGRPLLAKFDAKGGDTTTSGLTYNWVLGDGSVVQGSSITHTYPKAGYFTVSLEVGGSSGRIVDFGGDYGSKNVPFSGDFGIPGGDFDGDGAADDTLSKVPFSIEPSGAMVRASGRSGTINGGLASIRINVPDGRTSIENLEIRNSSSGDYIYVRDQPGSNTIHRAIYLWSKDGFLNGGHAQQVSFASNDKMVLDLNGFRSGQTLRWIVQNGEQFYVSEATILSSGTYTVKPAAIKWAPYDPVEAAHFDFVQATAVYESITFDDVRSAGVFIERDSPNSLISYSIRNFEVDATLSPVSVVLKIGDPIPGSYEEKFDDGSADHFVSQSGVWNVDSGVLKAESLTGRGIATINPQSFGGIGEQFGISTSLRIDEAGANGKAFLVLDWRDAANFIYVGYNSTAARWELGEVVAGETLLRRSHPAVVGTGALTSLRVAVNVGVVRVLDSEGGRLISYDFARTLNGGQLGLGVENANGSFDDFRIERVFQSDAALVTEVRVSGDDLVLRAKPSAGTSYHLELSPALGAPWQVVQQVGPFPVSDEVEIVVSGGAANAKGFFQLTPVVNQ